MKKILRRNLFGLEQAQMPVLFCTECTRSKSCHDYSADVIHSGPVRTLSGTPLPRASSASDPYQIRRTIPPCRSGCRQRARSSIQAECSDRLTASVTCSHNRESCYEDLWPRKLSRLPHQFGFLIGNDHSRPRITADGESVQSQYRGVEQFPK